MHKKVPCQKVRDWEVTCRARAKQMCLESNICDTAEQGDGWEVEIKSLIVAGAEMHDSGVSQIHCQG